MDEIDFRPRRTWRQSALPVSITLALHVAVLLGWMALRRERADNVGVHLAARDYAPILLLAPRKNVIRQPALAKERILAVPLRWPANRPKRDFDAMPAPIADALAPAPAPAPAAAATRTHADILDQAKRDIGKIDREIRGSAPPVPLNRPLTRQEKLERALAGAYRGGSNGFTLDRYTAPDGVIVTRKITSRGVSCYMSGTVNFVPGVLKNSERAQEVNCPPEDAGWTRL